LVRHARLGELALDVADEVAVRVKEQLENWVEQLREEVPVDGAVADARVEAHAIHPVGTTIDLPLLPGLDGAEPPVVDVVGVVPVVILILALRGGVAFTLIVALGVSTLFPGGGVARILVVDFGIFDPDLDFGHPRRRRPL